MDQTLESFWEACGGRGPLRLSVQDRDRPESEAVRTFARPFVMIGRDPRTDLVLEQAQVSRRHAYIQVIAGRPFCVDLDSRTAMSWSGSLRRSGWIERSRPVQLGRSRIALPPDSATDEAREPSNDRRAHDPLLARLPAAQPGEADAAAPLSLELTDPGSGSTRWRIDRPLTLVGRSPDCRLKLSDLTVSRFHCALVRSGLGLWVVDLLGRDGTFVNDESVRWARLERGDRLMVGRFHLVVRHEAGTLPRRRVAPSLGDGAPLPTRRGPARAALRIAASPSDPFEHTPLPAPHTPPLVLHIDQATARPAPSKALVPLAVPPNVPSPVAVEALVAELLPETLRHAENVLAPIVHQMAQMQQQMFEQYHQSMMTMMGMFGQIHRDQSRAIERELDEIRRLSGEVRQLQEQLAQDRVPPRPPTRIAPTPPLAASPAHQPAAPPPKPEPLGPPADDSAYRDAHAQLIQRMASLQQERQSRWQGILGRLGGGNSNPPPAK